MALPPKDEKVKRLGDEILNHIRDWLNRECQDATFRFLVNRWVYSRFQLDYRGETKRMKKALLRSGMTECRGCGPHQGNLEVHRIDDSIEYKEENCTLLCAACHKLEGEH